MTKYYSEAQVTKMLEMASHRASLTPHAYDVDDEYWKGFVDQLHDTKPLEIDDEDVVIKLPRNMAYNIYSWADIGMGLTSGVAKHDDSLVNTIKAMNSFEQQIGLNEEEK